MCGVFVSGRLPCGEQIEASKIHSRLGAMNKSLILSVLLGVLGMSACSPVQAHTFTHQMSAGNSCNGNYLDISAKQQPVRLSALGLHLSPGSHRLKVYTKDGSYRGAELDAGLWQMHGEYQVESKGHGKLTRVALRELKIDPLETKGVMIVSTHTLFYSNADQVESYRENADLSVYAADSICGEAFNDILHERVWNGALFYNEAELCFPVATENALIPLCL